jgi:hypothetical protein
MPQDVQVTGISAREFTDELRQLTDALPNRINLDSKSVERDLAKLVLTLIEFIRRLLEAQALRRMDGGGLRPEQVEELGLALMKLEQRMQELKHEFGLSDEDLNLTLGPLGKLF